MSLGVRLSARLPGRRGGAGPAEGGAVLAEGRAANLPVASPFVAGSPLCLRPNGKGLVLAEGDESLPVSLPPRPAFYGRRTAEGVPYRHIALLHGADCLASTVLQNCRFWATPARCRFCGIELSLAAGSTVALKTPAQLAEVAAFAAEHDGVRHVVLTTGTARSREEEVEHLARCARAVKDASGLPVHAQIMPPQKPGALDRLRSAGVDTLGIHIESFDAAVLRRMAPPKAALGLSAYVGAWRRAVECFGPGQVSSFVIAGLGERPESLLAGCELLSDLGVYPFLVPLRPIPGSALEGWRPPAPETMIGLYRRVAKMLGRKGISSRDCKAGCVRCGACSALAFFERPPSELICRPARTPDERRAALALRHRVFVAEQGLFAHSDRDPDDARSIHLVALRGRELLGTVRVFPVADSAEHWIGGRLAVQAGRRAAGVGKLLVREAVRTVGVRGCRRFTATIQEANVPFFRSLGWRPDGPPFEFHGRPHQPMAADLSSE